MYDSFFVAHVTLVSDNTALDFMQHLESSFGNHEYHVSPLFKTLQRLLHFTQRQVIDLIVVCKVLCDRR